MRFAVLSVLMVLNSIVCAATNANGIVFSSTTNTALTKVSRKSLKAKRPQCEATTLSGNRCKRRAMEGAKYCSQHMAIHRKHEKVESRK